MEGMRRDRVAGAELGGGGGGRSGGSQGSSSEPCRGRGQGGSGPVLLRGQVGEGDAHPQLPCGVGRRQDGTSKSPEPLGPLFSPSTHKTQRVVNGIISQRHLDSNSGRQGHPRMAPFPGPCNGQCPD